MSPRTLKILNLVSKITQNNIVPVSELPIQELPMHELPVQEHPSQEHPSQELTVQELPVQENDSPINIDEIPIVFEDQLLSVLSYGNSQNHNQTSENNNQTTEPNQSLPETSENNIISIDSRSENATVEFPSTSGISCNSKRKVEENSDSESCCSNGSVYEPEEVGEESSSSASEEQQGINLPETQFEQPIYGNVEEGRKRKKKANQA